MTRRAPVARVSVGGVDLRGVVAIDPDGPWEPPRLGPPGLNKVYDVVVSGVYDDAAPELILQPTIDPAAFELLVVRLGRRRFEMQVAVIKLETRYETRRGRAYKAGWTVVLRPLAAGRWVTPRPRAAKTKTKTKTKTKKENRCP